MNAQERALLVRFLDQLTAVQPGHKDGEAEALICEAAARQPDAHYLLVQRALQLEQALQLAQAQAGRLEAELDHGAYRSLAGAMPPGTRTSSDAAEHVAAGSFLHDGVLTLLARQGTDVPWNAADPPSLPVHRASVECLAAVDRTGNFPSDCGDDDVA